MNRYRIMKSDHGGRAIYDDKMSWRIIPHIESPGCDKTETSLQLTTRIVDYLNGQSVNNDQINAYEKFLKHIRDNFDCDDDAHKYGTPCRKCDAAQLLIDWNSSL